MNSMCDYHISPSHVFLSSIEPISNYLQQTTYLFNVMKVNGEHCRAWSKIFKGRLSKNDNLNFNL